MKKQEQRRKTAARIIAIILVLSMVVMSGFYIIAMFADADAGFTVYAAEAEVQTEAQPSGSDPVSAEDAEALIDELLEKYRINMLDSLLQYIVDNYKDPVTYDELTKTMMKSLFESLNDPWSEYYFNDEESGVEKLNESLNRNYGGVGITMQQDGEKVLITDVNILGPAYELGVKAGGYITAVNNISVAGKDISEVADMLRGEPGTVVNVSVQNGKLKTVYCIHRRAIPVATVAYEMLDDEVGYIYMQSMSAYSAIEFKNARRQLLSQGMKKLIIDLRNNPGGYVEVGVDIAGQLMKTGVICYYERQGEIVDKEECKSNATKKVPTVVIINEHTASAAELLAAALVDSGAAKTVGTKSFGKGVAQVAASLGNGDSFKLSSVYFLSPKKFKLDGVGITPQYPVELPEGSETDTQLEKAIEVVKKM